MASPFAQALAAAEPAFDEHMGDQVQITPMRSGDFARLPDPDRPAFDVVALVSSDDQASTDVPKLAARVVMENWIVEVRRSQLAGRLVRKGDEMILLDEQDSPRVVVNHVERLDRERMSFVCAPVSD